MGNASHEGGVSAPIGDLYGDGSRVLQDHFDARRLADRLAVLTVHPQLDDGDVELIGAQTSVYVSTVDADGWPDVSYKGGAAGFVEVATRTELRIPVYDGNGMFRTLGHVLDDPRVGLLFVDTTRPWRMRVQGRGAVSTDAADIARHHGAIAVLIITIERVFPNCGRYVHTAAGLSPAVPVPGHTPPVPDWKRIPQLHEVLPHDDPARAGDGS